jgi:hypothetical protein
MLTTAYYEAIDAYNKAVTYFLSNNVIKCNEIIDKKKKIEESDREIASKTFNISNIDGETICSICNIRDNIKRIAEWAALIAESTILRSYIEKT